MGECRDRAVIRPCNDLCEYDSPHAYSRSRPEPAACLPGGARSAQRQPGGGIAGAVAAGSEPRTDAAAARAARPVVRARRRRRRAHAQGRPAGAPGVGRAPVAGRGDARCRYLRCRALAAPLHGPHERHRRRRVPAAADGRPVRAGTGGAHRGDATGTRGHRARTRRRAARLGVRFSAGSGRHRAGHAADRALRGAAAARPSAGRRAA